MSVQNLQSVGKLFYIATSFHKRRAIVASECLVIPRAHLRILCIFNEDRAEIVVNHFIFTFNWDVSDIICSKCMPGVLVA